MAAIKVNDLAYIRLRSPDLGVAEQYLTDFGMTVVERSPTRLTMRGSDAHHHLHVTELGEPKVLGYAFAVPDLDALHAMAGRDGATGIEHIDEPGGGQRVRLTDPIGFEVELVHGIADAPALPHVPRITNVGHDRLRRAGALMRVPRRPSQVKRIGHLVLHSTDLENALAWYRDKLGLLCSDDVYAGSPDHLIASFNRLDRGAEFVDHHVLMVSRGARAGLNHVSFEVQDVDDVMAGHEYLRGKGYRAMWGVGRHYLGSQIFDYWQDPWGRIHEHWTDTDVLDASYQAQAFEVQEGFSSQWGEDAPRAFVEHSSV